jgi:hypothetical protein
MAPRRSDGLARLSVGVPTAGIVPTVAFGHLLPIPTAGIAPKVAIGVPGDVPTVAVGVRRLSRSKHESYVKIYVRAQGRWKLRRSVRTFSVTKQATTMTGRIDIFMLLTV